MCRKSVNVVLNAVMGAGMFVLWTISSTDGQAKVPTSYTCPSNFSMLKNAADEKKSICYNAAGRNTFYKARLECGRIGGYLMYMEGDEDVRLLEKPTSRRAIQAPIRYWIGIWTKNNKTVWDATGKEIERGDFHKFRGDVKRNDLTCAYRYGSTSSTTIGGKAVWMWQRCDTIVKTYCRAQIVEEPEMPTISFNTSYPSAQLRDLQNGDNLIVMCEANTGVWGELAIHLISRTGNLPNLTFAQGHNRTSIKTGPSSSVLTLKLFPVNDYWRRTIVCTSNYAENKAMRCEASDTHCAVLGEIQVVTTPRTIPPAVTTPAAPIDDARAWLTPTVTSGILSLVVGFLVGFIFGTISLKVCLRSKSLPVAEKSPGNEATVVEPGPDEELQQPGSVVESRLSDTTGIQGKAKKKGWRLDRDSYVSTRSGGTHLSKGSKISKVNGKSATPLGKE